MNMVDDSAFGQQYEEFLFNGVIDLFVSLSEVALSILRQCVRPDKQCYQNHTATVDPLHRDC